VPPRWGLQSCFHEGRGTLGNCPCQTMGTPPARRLGTLWAWASILHVIDGTLLLWISHLHGTVEQGLHLPGEEQLYRPLNAVVALGQHAFGALGDVNDRLVEQGLGGESHLEAVFSARG